MHIYLFGKSSFIDECPSLWWTPISQRKPTYTMNVHLYSEYPSTEGKPIYLVNIHLLGKSPFMCQILENTYLLIENPFIWWMSIYLAICLVDTNKKIVIRDRELALWMKNESKQWSNLRDQVRWNLCRNINLKPKFCLDENISRKFYVGRSFRSLNPFSNNAWIASIVLLDQKRCATVALWTVEFHSISWFLCIWCHHQHCNNN